MFMVDGLLSCSCSWLRNRSLTRFGVEATAGQRMVGYATNYLIDDHGGRID
jgi:hypothetical protein